MFLDNRRLRWSLAALVAAALGAGCAARADMDTLSQNEQSLREMIANDRQQMNQLQEEVSRLNDRVTELQHSGGARGGKQLASINDRLAKLESQMNTFTGASAAVPSGAPGVPGAAGVPEATGVPGAAGASAPGTAGTGSNAATAALAPGAAAPAIPAATPPPSLPEIPSWRDLIGQEIAAARNSSEPGSRLYYDGLVDMKAGRYPDAIKKFQAFQRTHPKSALTEPAEYFSANALFELGARDSANYNQAILQFNDLAMRYPRGRFAASAQLREAQAFLRTNDPLDARLTLQKLVRDHPGTAEASAASVMMKSMAAN